MVYALIVCLGRKREILKLFIAENGKVPFNNLNTIRLIIYVLTLKKKIIKSTNVLT